MKLEKITNKNKNKKILVTGGAGFIGTHLVNELLKQKHEVLVFDNFLTSDIAKMSNKINFVEGDITKKYDINQLPKDFDAIYHLAGLLDIKASLDEPSFYTTTNVMGTSNMLEFCRTNNIKKFIYAASCASDKPLSSPYALTKYLPEYYCNMYNNLYGIDTLNVRFYNVYGENMNATGYRPVLSIFLEKYSLNELLPIVGDGEQTRDFIYVGDIVSGLVKALKPNDTNIRTINLGNNSSISINDIVSMLGSPSTVNVPKRDETKYAIPANISLAKKLLEWEPKMKLETWIKEQIK